MWKKGNKVNYRNYVFDSQKEFLFYQRFLEKYDDDPNSEFVIKVHPSYPIISSYELESGLKFRGAKYTPDFTVEDKQKNLLHIYDVKNGFSAYAIDASCKLRFKLFTEKYGVPIECVVVLKNSFKVKVFGTTKKTQEHIFKDVNYDWRKAV